jgi:hypothetical protein
MSFCTQGSSYHPSAKRKLTEKGPRRGAVYRRDKSKRANKTWHEHNPVFSFLPGAE